MLDEEAHIEACLAAVLAQDYPRDRVEVLAVDGGSRDRTVELVRAVAGAAHHYATEDMDAATAFPGFFRRAVFDRVGGFDETLPVHEDYELNWRIRAAGGRVRYAAGVATEYVVRSSLRALAVQQFRYGAGKATVALRHGPGVMRPYHCVPPLFVAALGGAALAAPASRTARRLLGATLLAYGATLGGATLQAGRGRSMAERALIPAV